MKIIKYIILELMLLISLLLISTFVMKIFDVILNLKYDNNWTNGYKIRFIAWLELLIYKIIIKINKINKKNL